MLQALAWSSHVHHEPTRQWFSSHRSQGWATCPLTQLAFVRVSSEPAVVKTTVAALEAFRLLEVAVSAVEHEFWPMEQGLFQLLPEIRERLMGHHQLAGAVLLDLAVRPGCKLATLDRRMENLLAPGSPHRSVLEILPVE